MYDIDTRMMIYTYKYNLCVCMYVAITAKKKKTQFEPVLVSA